MAVVVVAVPCRMVVRCCAGSIEQLPRFSSRLFLARSPSHVKRNESIVHGFIVPQRMLPTKEQIRYNPKFRRLQLGLEAFLLGLHTGQIGRPEIGKFVKDVIGVRGRLPTRLIPKNQVDPLGQHLGDMVAFQRFIVLFQKVARTFRPRRQLHIVDPVTILGRPQLQPLDVHEKVGIVRMVKFGNEFLHVGVIRQNAFVTLFQTVKHAIGSIEFAILQTQHVFRQASY